MDDKLIKRYKKISYRTAISMLLLVITFYISSVVFSTQIFDQVVNMQEHPFPVVTAAGDIESSVLQMRALTERLVYIHTDDVINNVKQHYENIEVRCAPLAQTIVDRYLANPTESRDMQKAFFELMQIQYEYLEFCRMPDVTESEILEFINTKLTPSLDKMEAHLESIIDNATQRFDGFSSQAKMFRNFTIVMSTVLILSVIISILIYLYILNKKETEEKRLMSDMKVALAAAETANSAKSQFLSNMSHDIRTPMNAIIGMTAIAGTNMDNPVRVKDCLDKISASSKLLLGLINDVLDMSKIESGKIIMNEDEINLSELFQSVTTVIQPQIKAKNQDLRLSIVDVENEEVMGDSLRLQQVLMNLLSNAIKFTPVGGNISVRLIQKPSSRPGYGNYTFVVRDNGIGMDAKFMDHIFNPFEREKTSTVSRTEGTGLGLAITKSIVDMMGGRIVVESTPDVGTAFTIDIPMRFTEDAMKEIDHEALRNIRVLVVDDEQDICENTTSILQDLGMESKWVLSGREAVDCVQKQHEVHLDYHAVILDWKMPGMDGLETARQIRKIVGRAIPIIILTACDWSEIEDEAREAGISSFLAKPLFKSRLYETFFDLFGQNTTPDEPEEEQDVSINQGRVLIAEDNVVNIEIAETLVQSFGVQTETVINGQLAVDLIQSSAEGYFDMILMDIQMPIMDGYTASNKIRKFEEQHARKPVPIVALSANAFAEDVAKAKSVKMDDYLIKPIDVNQLKKILIRYIK